MTSMAQSWALSLLGLVTLCHLSFQAKQHQFLRESVPRLGFGYQVLPPTEVVTVAGAELLLPCQPTRTAADPPSVSWTHNGTLVSGSRRYVLPNGTLLITEVTASDKGQYQCMLHRAGYSVTSANLSLFLANTGTWRMRPRNSTVRLGSAVRLSCLFSSNPEATLTWLKDNQPLPEDSRYYQPTKEVLQITNIKQQDAGVYSCLAVNPLLKKAFPSPGGHLVVESGESQHALRPTLLAVPSKVVVEVGQRAVLECITDDISLHQLLWSRIDDRPIRTGGVRKEGQGSLVFLQVQEEDAAVYNCSVVNDVHRNPVTQMIELSVLKAPCVEVTMSLRNNIGNLSKPIRNGESVVRITCSTEGLPSPEISWYRNGVSIPVSARHKFHTIASEKNSTKQQLVITDIRIGDSGFYQCVVKNWVGVASEGFLLTVDVPSNMPKAPVNIQVNETTSKTILVVWSPPPTVNITTVIGYIVHYFEIDPMKQEKQQVTNNTYLLIEKLRPYTNYSIYIRTFIIFQDEREPVIGEPSQPIIWRTHADFPSRLPDVVLTALSPTMLRLTWTPLTHDEANGAIIHQRVQWRSKESHYHEARDILPDLREYDIRNLHPNTWYEARVLAATEAGYPPHNERFSWENIKMPKVDRNPQHPDKHIDFHLSVFSDKPTDILVEWSLAPALRPDVFTYEVVYNSTAETTYHNNTEASATSLVLGNLEPDTCYTVKVEPHYKDRHERVGERRTGRTICTLVPDPTNLPPLEYTDKIGIKKVKVKVLNTTSILVSWRPKGKRITPDFFTVEVASLGQQRSEKASPYTINGGGLGQDVGEDGVAEHYSNLGASGRSPREQDVRDDYGKSYHDDYDKNYHINGLEGEGLGSPQETEDASGGAREWQKEGEVRQVRVTRSRVVITHLLPLHGYQITVTASTPSLTSLPSPPHQAITQEGVPSAPVNVSWNAASPKDAVLVWGRPLHINGQLLYYLITYSHDQLEWKNQTVDHHHTVAKIQDLVSNTNYTLRIAGVTGGGVGSLTTVFVYIRATLEGEPKMHTELVVISVVCLLAAATCVVVGLLCLRMVRHRQITTSAAFQGGPWTRDDAIVANCLLDGNAVRMNEIALSPAPLLCL
ncbi:protogenin-like isoform X3 [Cherax quadricarinatus]|uniref:protogenin-like isoform X3 n=1 Tax=Cherax quadricarinatus TaxID=27406 RepID=UPI00387E2ED7